MAKKHLQTKTQPLNREGPLADSSRRDPIHERPESENLGFVRLITFSDGVFAIAITLLVLDIHLPDPVQGLGNSELLTALFNLSPHVIAYIISFLVIGSVWMTHHRKFRLIQRYDRRLMLLNLFLLMSVAFIPFPTSILSQSGNRTATIFYAITIAVTGLISILLSVYAYLHPSLLAPETNLAEMRHDILRGLITPLIFLGSIGLTYINEDLARFSWILIAPTTLLFHRKE